MYRVADPPALSRFPFFDEGVPDELKSGRVWVCCDENKAPMVALVRGWRAAKSTDPKTWRSYDEAAAAFETGRYAGVGRVIEQGGPYVGVDIDGCRDPETGQIDERGSKILGLLDSYSEVSPSGKGVKVWVRANLSRSQVRPGLEIYGGRRYFTVTGQLLPQFPDTVEERQAALEAVLATFFPPRQSKRERPYTGPAREPIKLDLLLEEREVEILAELADGSCAVKYAIRCPWVAEHTDGDESGTVVGQYPDGATFFHCHHAHCSARGWRDFWRATRTTTMHITRPGYTGPIPKVRVTRA